jgi:hypothetical protein
VHNAHVVAGLIAHGEHTGQEQVHNIVIAKMKAEENIIVACEDVSDWSKNPTRQVVAQVLFRCCTE